ncbi:MAG: preprotein translocase subunit SecG [Proteobacteria bacterium]|nr:preprotein translocase subunit SecG [Pseudomonadota bacterium]MCH8952401.1 preprotein translocase subunit SecG [Pseudomonadota bacterium]
MQNVVLIIHLIIAMTLIGVVLLQRSEGGALGIGGGGGGLVSQRGAATALSKITWVLAASFLCTSILLTILASGGSGSILDRFLTDPDGAIPTTTPLTTELEGGNLLPPAETVPAAPAPTQ